MNKLLAVLGIGVGVLFAHSSNGSPNTVYAPLSGNMKVLNLFPVVDTFSGIAQMFVFATDTAITFTGANSACLTPGTNPAQWFAIPKVNPIVGGAGDNPSYRDHVNTVMLAYSLNKGIQVWIDTCVGGYPRVVGILMHP